MLAVCLSQAFQEKMILRSDAEDSVAGLTDLLIHLHFAHVISQLLKQSLSSIQQREWRCWVFAIPV